MLLSLIFIVFLSLEDIILDIFNATVETEEVDYEQLQTDLYALHAAPINLNTATDEELEQLYFLSPRQIDDILAYVERHPMDSIYELRLIPSLADYEIRDLLPFVYVGPPAAGTAPLYAREVFHHARQEMTMRTDARAIEAEKSPDPIHVQMRYRFDYQRRVLFGGQLRRPEGGETKDLQYGGWIQLKDIGPMHTIVAGNYQASFGQGLVLAPAFHAGKSAYVNHVGEQRQGLRYYSSTDGAGLHGTGATFRHTFGRQTRLDVSTLYSVKRANDSTWHHLVGANVTLRHKRLQVELTGIENIWSDSIRPYRNAAYNEHYFRGYRQAVIGASARYNHGWFDLFGEAATAQNREQWGFGVIAGSRFYPTQGVELMLLYRYYSPWFDNALGYAFSESSRIGDENGFYLRFDVSRWRHWRISGYADLFYFSGRKYGISYAPSWGYDALLETQYRPDNPWYITLRLRAREKGKKSTYSARLQWTMEEGGWSFRTTAEANISGPDSLFRQTDATIPYGVSLYQDIGYTFRSVPLSLRGRLQFFDARQWDNRIYTYEHDVLYAFSIPAVYGTGMRSYLCLRWQIIPQLSLYLRVSETIYRKQWAIERNQSVTRTDIHLMLRAKI